jgi:hypothetical protein
MMLLPMLTVQQMLPTVFDDRTMAAVRILVKRESLPETVDASSVAAKAFRTAAAALDDSDGWVEINEQPAVSVESMPKAAVAAVVAFEPVAARQ